MLEWPCNFGDLRTVNTRVINSMPSSPVPAAHPRVRILRGRRSGPVPFGGAVYPNGILVYVLNIGMGGLCKIISTWRAGIWEHIVFTS